MITSPAAMGYRRTTGRAVHIFGTDTDTGAQVGTETVTGVHTDYRTGRKYITVTGGAAYNLTTRAQRGGTTRFAFAD